MAAHVARDPALSTANVTLGPNPVDEFGGIRSIAEPALNAHWKEAGDFQGQWNAVADVFQTVVDLAKDRTLTLRAGASLSKAIDLCEMHQSVRGHSQLRAAWARFRDVAHLIVAAANLASRAKDAKEAEEGGDGEPAVGASIGAALLIAPDAVACLATGYEMFGLAHLSFAQREPLLSPGTTWRVPPELRPARPPIVHRLLTQEQKDFLGTRRAAKKNTRRPRKDA
jgi:hypothetical protein